MHLVTAGLVSDFKKHHLKVDFERGVDFSPGRPDPESKISRFICVMLSRFDLMLGLCIGV
jgi:hypothetical protein